VLLTAHIIATGTWLGLAAAKLFLGVLAATATDAGFAGSLYVATAAVNVAFPPMAIGTVVTGVLLSLGTRWSLLQHTWVLVKLGLTVGVVISGIRFAELFARQAALATASIGSNLERVTITAPTPLIALMIAHVLMLGAATIISVYKPWGKSWFGRSGARAATASDLRTAARHPA
jgi:hypothetical protein